MRGLTTIAALASCLLGSSMAAAQDAQTGKLIYQDHCAVCHGDGGAGDGLVGVLFEVKPKNLTLLAQQNSGVFPFERVYDAISGKRELGAHGNTRMPIWGDFFLEEALTDRGHHPQDARALSQGRMLAVVYYLQTIQKQ